MSEVAPFFGSPLADAIHASRRVVIVGKGPTGPLIQKRKPVGVRIALNDAWRLGDFDAAHFTDFDAFVRCLKGLTSKVSWAVLPYYPHFSNRPDPTRSLPKTLATLTSSPGIPILTYAGSNTPASRYNLPRELGRPVTVRLFSAIAATHLAIRAGASEIAYFGVDGGRDYAAEFSDIQPLTNGRSSFDGQRPLIEAAARQHGVTVSFERGPM